MRGPAQGFGVWAPLCPFHGPGFLPRGLRRTDVSQRQHAGRILHPLLLQTQFEGQKP